MSANHLADLLGYDGMDENGIPIINPRKSGNSADIVNRAYNYALNPDNVGDFQSGVGIDPNDRIPFRGLQDDRDQRLWESQSTFGRIGNGAGRLIGSTILKTGQGVGFLGGMAAAIFDRDYEGQSFIDRATDSWLSQAFLEMEDGLKEALPIYKGRRYREGTLAQKATTLEFWMDDVVDGVAFMLSTYAPGGALAKIGAGGKLVMGTTKLVGGETALARTFNTAMRRAMAGEMTAPKLAKLVRATDKTINLATMTSVEAMFEADQVKKDILSDFELSNRFTQAQIEEKAAQAAADTYRMNMAALAFTNLIEVNAVFRRGGLFSAKGPLRGEDFINPSASRIDKGLELGKDGLARVADRGLLSSIGKNPYAGAAFDIVSNAIGEGFLEENLQYTIEQLNKRKAQSDEEGDSGWGGAITDLVADAIQGENSIWRALDFDDPETRERREAVLLGSIIGGGTVAVQNAVGGGVIGQQSRDEKLKEGLKGNINKSIKAMTTADIFKTKPRKTKIYKDEQTGQAYSKVKGKKEQPIDEEQWKALVKEHKLDEAKGGTYEEQVTKTDKSGSPVIDSEKLDKWLKHYKNMSELNELINLAEDNADKNQLVLQLLKNEQLSRLALTHFEAGLGKEMVERIRAYKGAKPEELMQLGIDPNLNQNVDAIIEEKVAYVQKLEELYNSIEEGILPNDLYNDKESWEKNKQRQDYLYNMGQRALSIESLMDVKAREIAELEAQASGNMPPEFFAEKQRIRDEQAAKRAEIKAINKKIDKVKDKLEEQEAINQGVLAVAGKDPIQLADWKRANEMQHQKIMDDNGWEKLQEELAEKKGELLGLHEEMRKKENLPSELGLKAEISRIAMEDLQESRDQMQEEWIKVTDPWSGYDYFNKNKAKLEGTLKTDLPFMLRVTPETSLREYLKYEKRMVRRLKILDKVAKAKARANDTKITNRILNNDPADIVIQEVLDKKMAISQAIADNLANYLQELVDERDHIQGDIDSITDEINSTLTEIDILEQMEQDEDIIREINELKGEVAQLQSTKGLAEEELAEWYKENDPNGLIKGRKQILKDINNLVESPNLKTDNQQKKEALKKYTVEFDSIKANFDANPDYQELDTINDQIAVTEGLIGIFEQREDTPFHDGKTLKKLKKMLKALKKMRKAVEKRMGDRKIKEARIAKDISRKAYQSIGLDTSGNVIPGMEPIVEELKKLVGEKKFNQLIAEAKQDLKDRTKAYNKMPKEQQEEVRDLYLNDAYPMLIIQIANDVVHTGKGEPKITAELNKIANKVLKDLRKIKVVKDSIDKKVTKASIARESNRRILKNAPKSPFKALVQFLQANTNDGGIGSSLDSDTSVVNKFLSNLDLAEFEKAVPNQDRSGERVTKGEILELLQHFRTLMALDQLVQGLKTTKNTMELLHIRREILKMNEKQMKKGASFTPAPSAQQEAVIDDATRMLSQSKLEDLVKRFGNWVYLRGFAATGKTTVFTKYVFELLGIDPDSIYAAGHLESSTKTIEEAVDAGQSGTIDNLVKDLKKGKIRKGIEYIVVDEIAGATSQQIDDLATAVQEFNTANPGDAKTVIVMGDPNQITDGFGISTIESYEEEGATEGISNMRLLQPLTLKFRSDNPVINAIQAIFTNRSNPVDKIIGKINIDVKDVVSSPKPLKGVYVENSPSDGINILKQSIKNTPKGVSRLYIVKNQSDKTAMQNTLEQAIGKKYSKHVEVVTYKEAQGRTVNEVYVDLPRDTKEFRIQKGDHKQYNKAMHVAISRAVDFAYVAHIPESEVLTDEFMEDKIAKNKAEKVNNFPEKIDALKKKLKVFKDHYEKPEDDSVKEKKEKEPEKKTVKKKHSKKKPKAGKRRKTTTVKDSSKYAKHKESKGQKDAAINKIPLVDAKGNPIPKKKIFTFSFPDNTIFDAIRVGAEKIFNGLTSILNKNPNSVDVHFFKTKKGIAVGVPMKYEGQTMYKIVSVEDTDGFLDGAISKQTKEEGTPGLVTFTGKPVAKGKILNSSNDITYVYNDDPTKAHKLKGENGILNLYDRWEDAFTQGKGFKNSEDVRENLQVAVFDDPTIKNWRKNKRIPDGFTIDKGVPYLVIEGWIAKGGKHKGKTQFIRLSPGKLNQDTHSHLLQPIRDFIKAVKNVEKQFKKIADKRGMADFAKKLGGVETKDGKKNTFSLWVTALSDFSQRRGEKDWMKNQFLNKKQSRYKFIFKRFPDFVKSPPEKLIAAARAVDELVHGTWDSRIVEPDRQDPTDDSVSYKERSWSSEAQRSMDAIGTSNLYTSAAGLGFVLLRDNRPKFRYDAGKKESTRIESPSGIKLMVGANISTRASRLEGNVRDDLIDYASNLEARWKKQGKLSRAQQDQLNGLRNFIKENKKQWPITVEQLETIFGSNSFSRNGDSKHKAGFGLRAPVEMLDFLPDSQAAGFPTTNEGDSIIERDLISTFETVIPTKIQAVIFDEGSTRKVGGKTYQSLKTKKHKSKKKQQTETLKKGANKFGRRRNRKLKKEFLDVNDATLGEKITPEEAAKLYKEYFPDSVFTQMKRAMGKLFFPNMQQQEHEKDMMRIVSTMEMERVAGEEAYGLFKEGLILLESQKDGTVFQRALKHEAFHKILHNYLTAEEYDLLMSMARAQYPEQAHLDNYELEEFLARVFQARNKGETTVFGMLRRLFDKILRFLGFVNANIRSIDDLMEKIEYGYFSGMEVRPSGVTMPLNKVKQNYGNSAVFQAAKEEFLYELSRVYNHREYNSEESGLPETYITQKTKIKTPYRDEDGEWQNLPMTFNESLEKVFDVLNEYRKYLKAKRDTKKGLTAQEHLTLKGLTAINKKKAKLDFVDTMFPNVTLQDIFAEVDDVYVEGVTRVNLKDEIESLDEKDARVSIASQVKQLLSGLVNVEDDFVSFKQAFVILADVMGGLPTGDTKAMKEELQRRFEGTHLNYTNGKAVRNFIFNMIDSRDLVERKDISFKKDGQLLVTTNGKSAWTTPIDRKSKHQIILDIGKYQTLGDFIVTATYTLADHGINTTVEELSMLYAQYRARNNYGNVMSALGSLIKRKPMVATRKSRGKGKQEHKYFITTDVGPKAIYRNAIEEGIAQKMDKNKDMLFTATFRGDVRKALKKPAKGKKDSKDKARKKVIASFLYKANIRIKPKDVGLQGADLLDAVEDLSFLIKRFDKAYQKHLDKKTNKKFPARKFMLDQGTLLTKLSTNLGNADNTMAPSNYIKGDGKTSYLYKRSSFGEETLSSLVLGNEAKQPKYFKSKIVKNNIFISGQQQVHSIRDHDSTKWAIAGARAKTQDKETRSEWLDRNFNFAFGAFLKSSKKAKRYLQPVWTVSNKKILYHAEVNLLENDAITEAIGSMIEAAENRPGGIYNKVKDYANNKNKYGIIGLEKLSVAEGKKKSPHEKISMVLEAMDRRGIHVVQALMDENIQFDTQLGTTLETVGLERSEPEENKGNKIANKYLKAKKAKSREDLTDKQIAELDKLLEEERDRVREANKGNLEADLLPLARLFFKNWYINSHQLNDLVIGQDFVSNTTQTIKRQSIFFGGGTRGVVHDEHGMKKESRVAVLEDLRHPITAEALGLPGYIAKEIEEATDGAAFVTSEYFERLRRGHGVDAKIDTVLKPVYAGRDKNGIPRAIKFAAFVITDEMIQAYPDLQQIRDMMENPSNNIDIVTFSSAVKVGLPLNVTKVYQRDKDGKIKYKKGIPQPLLENEMPTQFEPESIFTINNENMRLQFNPSADTNSKTANPSQFTYFPVLHGETIPVSDKIFKLNAEVIRTQLRALQREFRLNRGNINRRALEKIRRKLLKSWEAIAGSERLWEIMSYKVKEDKGDYGVSNDYPLAVPKIISQLSSMISKNTVDFDFPGTKLVLQPQFGTYSAVSEKLKWKLPKGKYKGFAEVYLPASMEKYISKGDTLSSIDQSTAFGFRVPTSGLHLGLPLVVKGFHGAVEDTNNNVVIAPSEIINIQGVDFDIDSMFIIRRTKARELKVEGRPANLDLKEIAEFIDPKKYTGTLKFDPDLILGRDKLGNKIYLDERGRKTSKKKGIPATHFVRLLQERLREVELETLPQKHKKSSPENKARLKKLGTLLDMSRDLDAMYLGLVKNDLADSYIDIMISDENKAIVQTPVSLDRLKGKNRPENSPSMIQIIEGARGKKFDDNKDAADVLVHREMHYSVFSGDKVVGIAASFTKALAYLKSGSMTTEWIGSNGETYTLNDLKEIAGMQKTDTVEIIDGIKVTATQGMSTIISRASKKLSKKGVVLTPSKKEAVKLKQELNVQIDGKYYGDLPQHEGNSTKRPRITETLDSLLQAALDNVKEQILPKINLTVQNAPAYLSSVALGIPLETVMYLWNSPVMQEISKTGEPILRNNAEGKKVKAITDKLMALIEAKVAEDNKTEELNDEQRDELVEKLGEVQVTSEMMAQSINTWYQAGETLEALDLQELMQQFAVLSEVHKLHEIGEFMSDNAKVLGILSEFPSTYPEITELLDIVFNDISDFGNTEATKKVQKAISKEVDAIIENDYSDAWKALKTEKQKEEFKKRITRELYADESIQAISRRTVFNQLIDDTHNRFSDPVNTAPFINASITNVPNVKQAIMSLMMMQKILQQMVTKYSPTINTYVDELRREYGFSDFLENKEETNEAVRNSLVRYLLSTLVLELPDGQSLDLSVAPTHFFNDTEGNRITGTEAWLQEFLDDLSDMKDSFKKGESGNTFFEALQIRPNLETNTRYLVFTLDKISDPDDIQAFVEDFEALGNLKSDQFKQSKKKQKYGELQKKLFKYLALTSGLEFGRTSIAQAVPDDLHRAYSKALTARFNEFVDVKHRNDLTTSLLQLVRPDFMMQFAVNNLNYVKKLNSDSAVYSKEGSAMGVDEKFHVSQDGTGLTVKRYYDYKFDFVSNLTESRFNSKYPKVAKIGNSVFYRVTEHNQLFTDAVIEAESHHFRDNVGGLHWHDYIYYQRMNKKSAHSFYNFNIDDLINGEDAGLDLDKIFTLDIPIRNSRRVKKNIYTPEPNARLKLEKGDIIGIYHQSDLSHKTLTDWKVLEVYEGKEEGSFSYKLGAPAERETGNPDAVQKYREDKKLVRARKPRKKAKFHDEAQDVLNKVLDKNDKTKEECQ